MARCALLFVMMTFFAVLALDISVPAVVLSLMALSNIVVLPRTGAFPGKVDTGFPSGNALKKSARRGQVA